jgi:hypothetical protein
MPGRRLDLRDAPRVGGEWVKPLSEVPRSDRCSQR